MYTARLRREGGERCGGAVGFTGRLGWVCVRVGKWSRPIEQQLRGSARASQQLWPGWLQLRIPSKPSDIADWWKTSFWRWWIGYLTESNQTSEPSTCSSDRLRVTSDGQPKLDRQGKWHWSHPPNNNVQPTNLIQNTVRVIPPRQRNLSHELKVFMQWIW